MGFKPRAPLGWFDLGFRLSSIRMTQMLQWVCGLPSSPRSHLMRSFNSITETSFLYLYIYPICTLIHPLLGFQIIVALITSEWVSVVLKCIIPDLRPYWWFPTTEYSPNGAHETTIYEFPETCETTSGFPSSHSMLSAACSIIILRHFQERLLLTDMSKTTMKKLELIMQGFWFAYNFFGVLGRVFVTASFYYQTIAGCFMGYCIGIFVYDNAVKLFSFNTKNGHIMLGTVFGSLLLFILGFTLTSWDPFWTVPEALKWCWNTHHVYNQIKKTILYFALRVAGSTAGFVFSNNVAGIWLRMGSTSWPEKALLGIFYFLEIQAYKMLESYGAGSQILVYAVSNFILSIFHVILVTALLPTLANKLNKIYLKNAGTEAQANILGCFSTLPIETNRHSPGAYRTDENATAVDTDPLIDDGDGDYLDFYDFE